MPLHKMTQIRLEDVIVMHAEKGTNILIMVDDAYSGFWYDTDVMHESIFGVVSRMPSQRCFCQG